MEEAVVLPRPWLMRALDLEMDREHGAAYLSREAVRAFREAADEAWTPDADPEHVRAMLREYAGRLRRARPGMASLSQRLAPCIAALDEGREAVLATADAVLAAAEQAEAALIASAGTLLMPGARVLTHGFSQTVLGFLTHHADRLERITVCEARPLNEGGRLAQALGDLALPVRLITEGQMELFAPECDIAIVGAERILPGGEVVARAGTAVVARVCAAHGVRFYVAADESKWVNSSHELAHFRRERRAPTEMLASPPPGVEISNIAFDLTPAALVSGYVTEKGIVEPAGAAAPASVR